MYGVYSNAIRSAESVVYRIRRSVALKKIIDFIFIGFKINVGSPGCYSEV